MSMTLEKYGSINELNALLTAEISACETYGQAIQKVHDDHVRAELAECEDSHRMRVQTLRKRIEDLGAEPVDTSGIWGALARFLEGGAALLGDRVAVAVLQGGEDHGLKDYRAMLEKLDPGSRLLVLRSILPAQEYTHKAMSALKKTLH